MQRRKETSVFKRSEQHTNRPEEKRNEQSNKSQSHIPYMVYSLLRKNN